MKTIWEKIFLAEDFESDLRHFFQNLDNDKIFIICDSNTEKYCLPKLSGELDKPFEVFVFPAGEAYKNINTAIDIWRFLSKHGADRHSLIVNLGGGVVSDLGGFVASTFKRGIDYINIPTTLLAQVDASIGGKTGVNLNFLKNEVGSFYDPKAVLISTEWLKTLPDREFLSGFAEIVKHALLTSEEDWNLVKHLPAISFDENILKKVIENSVKTKMRFVKEDPKDTGIRKALNFGHTVGHAIETFFQLKGVNILHGEAVAIGMIAEIFLSNQKFIFDFHKVFEISELIARTFPAYRIQMKDYEEIYEIMKHDKKNRYDQIRFTLLKDIGKYEINQTADKPEIFEALNFYSQIR